MLEAAEAKELIDEAVEEEEKKEGAERAAEAAAERGFRNRVALLVGVFAVLLAVVHMAAAGAARESLLTAVQASDTFNYMQAKTVREAIFRTAAAGGAADAADRATFAAEAKRLREPDKAGHGIDQLREKGQELERENAVARRESEGYELGETALQVAIVLLSIAIVARSGAIVIGAVAFAVLGVGLALVTRAGLALPWVG